MNDQKLIIIIDTFNSCQNLFSCLVSSDSFWIRNRMPLAKALLELLSLLNDLLNELSSFQQGEETVINLFYINPRDINNHYVSEFFEMSMRILKKEQTSPGDSVPYTAMASRIQTLQSLIADALKENTKEAIFKVSGLDY